METVQIDILNPKAKKLLKDLADLNLIKINREKTETDFSAFLNKLRTESKNDLSLEEITDEVNRVRKSRYEE